MAKTIMGSKVATLLQKIAEEQNISFAKVELIYNFIFRSTSQAIARKAYPQISLLPIGMYKLNEKKEYLTFENVVLKSKRKDMPPRKWEDNITRGKSGPPRTRPIVVKKRNLPPIMISFSELKKTGND